MKKWICTLLCMALVLGLAACSQPASQQQGTTSSVKEPEVFGMLTLNMNAIVNISYDKDGLVLSVTPENEMAEEFTKELTASLGASCSKIVCDLITAISESAYAQDQNAILLKQTNGSQSPSETFLEDIALDAQKSAGSRTLIVAAVDTLTDEGYLSLDTAKEILTKQLGLENATLAGDPTVQDGYYWISVTQDDMTSEYSVDANLGTIEMLPTEPSEEDAEGSIDDIQDPTMNTTPEDTYLEEETVGDPFENGDGIIFGDDENTDPAAESTGAA